MRAALEDAYITAASIGQIPGYAFDPGSHVGHFHRTATGNRGGRDITDILAIIWSRKSSQITQLFSFQLHRYLLGIHLEGLRKELFYALIDSC